MKLLRNLLKGASLTTALFIFQACYGVPQADDLSYPLFFFNVTSAEDGNPLANIAVKMKAATDENDPWHLAAYSNSDGRAQVIGNRYVDFKDYQFRFESEEGSYIVKDTVVSDFSSIINIRLEKTK